MLYKLSAFLLKLSGYLVNGLLGLFFGAFSGSIAAIVICGFLSSHSLEDRAPGDGVELFDWIGWGLFVGAVLGLGMAAFFSCRRLQSEQVHRELLTIAESPVWPPPPNLPVK